MDNDPPLRVEDGYRLRLDPYRAADFNDWWCIGEGEPDRKAHAPFDLWVKLAHEIIKMDMARMTEAVDGSR